MSKIHKVKKSQEMHRISIPIYRDTLNVFFGSLEDAKDEAVNDGIPRDEIEYALESKKFVNGRFRYLANHGYWLICVPCVPETVAQFGTMVHEIEHFVFFFLKERGMEHTEDSDEAYAYLFEFLYCETMNIINELNEKKNG